jgi:serine phosphatase RsbU (regulator of sigma subunit)
MPPMAPGGGSAQASARSSEAKNLDRFRSRRGPDSRIPDAAPPSEGGGATVTPASGSPTPSPTPDSPNPAGASAEESDRIRIDVGPIARDIFRQFVPEGTNPNDLTAEQRQRVAAEINQRMTGINEGIKLAAAELQRKADLARRKAEDDAKAAQTKAAAPLKRRTALTGSRLAVTMEQNGKVVRTANAEINLPNVLMTVFSTMPRTQGEVPFAVGKDGRVYTPTVANRAAIEQLTPAKLPNGASMIGEWVVVMTSDPTGSGLRLGIARPVADSLSELRRTAGRNAGLGLAFIGLSIILIVPLSGRLTRNLSRLTDAVTRFAHGEYGTRVSVKSKDEIGELAGAFNQMAAEVEVHQRAVVEQERLKRELELGRQIQHDMQPQEPLRLGLTEIEGVSVPAREVGGDFFNYFALPDGQVALLVGDVSGKGVGAALLMANIQASLRTRFALGQDLSAIVDAIDREIETNSPGQMYATLFVGILDPGTRRLRYVNAGHHPQYVLPTRGGLDRMSATGLPAGLLAGRGYVEKDIQLERGDLIFFYTDGCPETENPQEEMFGSERLESLLILSSSGGTSDVLLRVETALKEFRDTREPYDDATMMAVRVG